MQPIDILIAILPAVVLSMQHKNDTESVSEPPPSISTTSSSASELANRLLFRSAEISQYAERLLEKARKMDGLALIAAAARASQTPSPPADSAEVIDQMVAITDCYNGGVLDPLTRMCNCTKMYGGLRCEAPVCLNGGQLDEVTGRVCRCQRHTGIHCQWPDCEGGTLNHHRNVCECIGNYFGRYCELFCWHGQLINGFCTCYEGYDGITCNRCESASPGGLPPSDCAEQLRQRRRPVMQSRFALSGLSLCLITIILLWISVVSRRRRSMLAAAHVERLASERLLRVRQQGRRVGGGDQLDSSTPVLIAAGLPRSRGGEFRLYAASALFGNAGGGRCTELRPSLETMVNWGRRTRFDQLGRPGGFFRSWQTGLDLSRPVSESPPPIYCSTDDIHQEQLEAPPSYEEAIIQRNNGEDETEDGDDTK